MEIIPKKTPQIPQWLNYLFYLSVILLILVVAAIFVLDNYINKSKEALSGLDEAIKSERTQERLALEKEVQTYARKIEDFSKIISQHLENSGVFVFLQSNCHPQVWFSQFTLDSLGNKIGLDGKSKSFKSLGQQILIFQEEKLVKSVNLEKVSLNKEGGVDFSLSLILDPQIFIFK